MPETIEQELGRLRRRNAELEAALAGALEEILAPRSLLDRIERIRARLSRVAGFPQLDATAEGLSEGP